MNSRAGDRLMNEGEHLSHFARCKDNGQFLALLRTDETKDWPLAFEGLLIEKLDPVQINGERASGNVLDVDEIEKELSDLLFAQLKGEFVPDEMWKEGEVVDIREFADKMFTDASAFSARLHRDSRRGF